ncbi:dioxygenase [Gracilaria domingensis]|nr:dioxygenase [Gracilaria domingensis]
MMKTFPPLFLSHGAPTMALSDAPVKHFLVKLGARLAKPRAAVVISAHFETTNAAVVTDPAPRTTYDFGNFDDRLFKIKYPAPGNPELGDEVFELLRAADISVKKVAKKGYDHGVWVPLSLMWPDADVPIVQVSIDPDQGTDYHYRLGKALRSLPKKDIAVIGTGNISHNLPVLFSSGQNEQRDAEFKRRVQSFLQWFDAQMKVCNVDNLLHYRDKAPFAKDNHPTDDHLMPLYVAMGAAGGEFKGRKIHESFDFGILAMDAWEFVPHAGS